MPINSKVHRLYKKFLSQGMNTEKAVRIAQSQTGLSLATGKKPKSKRGRK